MSRIGRMPIAVPSGVEVTIAGQHVAVKGPKGSLSLNVAEPIQVSQEAGVITVARPNEERVTRSLHGLSRTLVARTSKLSTMCSTEIGPLKSLACIAASAGATPAVINFRIAVRMAKSCGQ